MTVGVLLDLHASITDTLLQHASLVTVIKEYPHTDFPETARQLVTLGMSAARRSEPVTAFVPVPVFTLWHSRNSPARHWWIWRAPWNGTGRAAYIPGSRFPWSDVHSAGAAVLVTTDDAPSAPHSWPQTLRASCGISVKRTLAITGVSPNALMPP